MFGKEFVCSSTVKKKEGNSYKTVGADVFEINPKDKADKDYFENLDKKWHEKGNFLTGISLLFQHAKKAPSKRFYALEDKNGKTLCVAVTGEVECIKSLVNYKAKELCQLDLIETHPDFQHRCGSREYKDSAEALTAGIVKEAQAQGKKGLFLIPSIHGHGFYAHNKCFCYIEKIPAFFLDQSDFDRFLEYSKNK